MRPPPAKPRPSSRLRAARAADLDALVALEQACFRTERMDRAAFRRALANPRAELPVIVQGGALLAAALAWIDERRGLARLYSIAVAREARGLGLGTRLLRQVERRARARGAARLRLEVRSRNRAARALYARHGYTPIAHLPGYYADGGDGLRYQKSLGRR